VEAECPGGLFIDFLFLKTSSEMRLQVPNSRRKYHILTRHFLPKNERMDEMRNFPEVSAYSFPYKYNETTSTIDYESSKVRILLVLIQYIEVATNARNCSV
jgi:hypothetical protein